MEFLSTAALSSSWRQYNYMNHLAIKDAIIHCEDIKQSIIFWKAYKHFFNTSIEPKQFVKATKNVWNNYEHYVRLEKDHNYSFFKTYLKKEPLSWNNQAFDIHSLVYSIIDSSVHKKGIPRKSKEDIITNLGGYNLGDSRNFKNEQWLISKITKLAAASTYMGSNCSWSNIAPLFDTKAIILRDEGLQQ